MKYKNTALINRIGRGFIYCVAIAGAMLVVEHGYVASFGESSVVFAQQDAYLSRRIDQMESRFYSIETRLNNLETATRPTLSSPPLTSGSTDRELSYLRQQVDALRTRLGEAECGLLRVDERTLTPAARAARQKSVTGPDPCRRDPAAPVTLSSRP